MMKVYPLFFALCATLLMSIAASAQTTVSRTVQHITDVPSTSSGCSVIRLDVTYTLAGSGGLYINSSSSVQLDQNNSTTLSVTLPAGATIVNEKIYFSFNFSSNTYTYFLTNSANTVNVDPGSCYCPGIASNRLVIQEISGRSAKIVFHTTSAGPC